MDTLVRQDESYRPAPDDSSGPETEFSLLPLLLTLWRYRRTMTMVMGAIVALFVIFILSAYLTLPSERVGSMGFRLLFDGADKGQYPNGVLFSSAEIVEAPVLAEVYKIDELKQYLPYEDFKKAIFILQSNPALDLLNYEYQAKLADTRLTATDRTKLEAEFRTKSEALKDPLFSLNYRRLERGSVIPASLVAKVLSDTLATWARQAQDQKGALSYVVPVYSKNIVRKDFLSALDYAIAVDVLRTKVQRILDNLTLVEALPGAATIRTGAERVSLAELRVNLDDLLRFKIQPLMAVIRSAGLSKDPRMLGVYFDDRLFQVKLEKAEVERRMKSTQDSMREYVLQKGGMVPGAAGGSTPQNRGGILDSPALIPQFGESFLDRIVQLGNQNSDVKYRQQLTDKVIAEGARAAQIDTEITYYEDFSKSMRTSARAPSASASVAADVQARADAALNEIMQSVDQINVIYQDLSAHNLNPNTLLYSITTPFTTRIEAALPLRTILVYGMLVLLLSLILVPAAVLVYEYLLVNIRVPWVARG